MHVTNVIPRYIVHHNSFVEGVKSEKSILPPLLLPSQIAGIKATILEYGCCVLGRGNRESWSLPDTGGRHRGGHGGRSLVASLSEIRILRVMIQLSHSRTLNVML